MYLMMKRAVIIGLILTLLCIIRQSSDARSVIREAAVSYSIGSVPVQNSGFYYSDSYGNSIGVSQTSNVPVLINQYPNAVWVSMTNGQVPSNAIVSQYINGYPLYFCRVQNYNRFIYGQLVPNQGCYISNQQTQPFRSYQILVR